MILRKAMVISELRMPVRKAHLSFLCVFIRVCCQYDMFKNNRSLGAQVASNVLALFRSTLTLRIYFSRALTAFVETIILDWYHHLLTHCGFVFSKKTQRRKLLLTCIRNKVSDILIMTAFFFFLIE